jgi:hypothetical protein
LAKGVGTCARIAFIEYPPGYPDRIHQRSSYFDIDVNHETTYCCNSGAL